MRIIGSDGVSLETKKWVDVLDGMGLECRYLTGQSDRPAERMLIEKCHFQHPRIAEINLGAFRSALASGERNLSPQGVAGSSRRSRRNDVQTRK